MNYKYKKIKPAELLKINPGMLRAIHNVFRIDWNKPAVVVKFDAPPTKNAVVKTMEALGIYGPAAVLMHRAGKWASDYDRRRLYCFTVCPGGSLEIPKIGYSENTGGALDTSWRKKDFDDWRKDAHEKLTVFTVFQAKEHRTPEKPVAAPNEYTRYTATGEAGFYNHGPKSYKLISLDRSEIASASIGYWYHNRKEQHDEISDIIDKSGYFVKRRRENLKKRAAALRAERAKTSYSAQDTAADVAEIENAATETRLYIADALRNADTITAGKIIEAIHFQWGSRYAFPDAAKRAQEARSHAYKDRETADEYKADALKGLEKLRAAVVAAIEPAAEEVKTA